MTRGKKTHMLRVIFKQTSKDASSLPASQSARLQRERDDDFPEHSPYPLQSFVQTAAPVLREIYMGGVDGGAELSFQGGFGLDIVYILPFLQLLLGEVEEHLLKGGLAETVLLNPVALFGYGTEEKEGKQAGQAIEMFLKSQYRSCTKY